MEPGFLKGLCPVDWYFSGARFGKLFLKLAFITNLSHAETLVSDRKMASLLLLLYTYLISAAILGRQQRYIAVLLSNEW